MEGDSPYFIWQREYNRRWKMYTYDEHTLLNTAVTKNQKTLTLPSIDTKKVNVNLEKMIQKNSKSGYSQRVRVLVSSGPIVCWSWKDDYDDWVSFTPRLAFYLELAHYKQLEKVSFFFKSDYEIDLKELTQTNKETNYVRPISREEIDMPAVADSTSLLNLNRFNLLCHKKIKELSQGDISSLHDLIFDVPTSKSKSHASYPLQESHHENVVRALQEEVESSIGSSSQVSQAIVPADPDCPEANNYSVYCEDGDIYSETLNLTSLQANSNKYFILQVLKHHNKVRYAVWFHWGRTGYKGQNNFINCGSNLAEAKAKFENKFYEKTRNEWAERHSFERVPSKYDLVHTDYVTEKPSQILVEDSKLHIKIQSLLNMICDEKSLEKTAQEMSYDSNTTPLGKITKKQILDGYKALDALSKLIQAKVKGKQLVEACNNFYTKIPHDFKRKTPTILQTMEDIKEKLNMLEALSNIGVAMDLMNQSITTENPVDKYYRSLECNLSHLDYKSAQFHALQKCLKDTHGPTHDTYKLELLDAFECSKNEQHISFEDYGNKMLLWHGSRMSNWIGILKKGLQIAPREAPSTGYMFGKGIYFADICSKSANYCFATKKNNEGILLLSEVSLGNSLVVYDAEDYSRLPNGYNSVRGEGRIIPAGFETTVLSSEATLPFGPLKEIESDDMGPLIYNEYIVYNVNQVKMKYILHVKFNF